MVSRQKDGRAVQVVDDEAHQLRQLFDGLRRGLEGFGLGATLVANRINAVVIDVHHLVGFDEIAPLVLALFHQVIAANGHATVPGQNGAALLQRDRRHASTSTSRLAFCL